MKTMMTGFSGWARMRSTNNASIKVADTAITVVVTLLAAVTFVVLRG